MNGSDAFAEACAFLFPRVAGAERRWSLGPTTHLLDTLGHPERLFPSVHIGGTNGKGSVAAMVAAALAEHGLRVGVYTSPHLVDVCERMVVAGTPISHEAFAAWTETLRPAILETEASFFEATTAMAFADFAARSVDIAVVEVGLGGRLDSTNVVRPLVSAVTNVGWDHTEYLGPTLEAIAREKAGIAKDGVPFVLGDQDAAVRAVLADVAAEAGAMVVRPPDHPYEGPLRLLGAHQGRNAAVALTILDALPPSLRPTDDERRAGLARAWVAGRLDRRGRYVLDVAHNAGGIGALVEGLAHMGLQRPVHVLLGVLGDKDLSGMVRGLRGVADAIWITHPPDAPRARRARLDGVELGAMATVDTNFDRAWEAAEADAGTMVVTGSFFTVAAGMARLPGFAPFG